MSILIILSYFLFFLSGMSAGVAFIMWETPKAKAFDHVYNGIICFQFGFASAVIG